MKKGISAILAGSMAMSMFASLASAADTTMTTQQRYEMLEEAGIFTGFEDGTARLNERMTRAQFARVAALLLELDLTAPPATATFRDVPKGHWAFEEVEAAVDAGIISGVGNGLFNPNANVTIQEMARVLVDALGIEEEEFEDAEVEGKVAAWAVPYVAAAVESGLIPESADYTRPATRGQLVDASAVAYEELSFSIASTTVTNATTIEVTFSDGTKETFTLDEALVVGQATEVTFEHMGRTFTTTVTLAASPLSVAKAVSLSNNSIELTLNAAVTAVSPASFTLKNAAGAAVTVNSATLSADGKTVLLSTGALTPLQINTLTVGGNNFQVVGAPADATAPTLLSAVAATNTSVTLTFSERMGATAAAAANYAIAGLTVTGATVSGNTVTLTTSAQTPGTVYKVVVTNAADISGNVVNANNDEASFGGIAADTTKPTLTAATADSNTRVRLQFSEAVNATTAAAAANYAIAGLTVTAATVDAADNRVVWLTTSAQTPGTVYKVTVTNVTDVAGNVVNADADEFSFGGVAADTTKPTLTSATATTNTKVRLVFSENVDATTAAAVANYAIPGLTVTAAAVDANTVTLTTSAQTPGTIYKVTVTNVTDANANVINADADEFSFGGLAADTTAPTVVSAVSRGNGIVRVTFSETVVNPMPYQFNFGTELGYAYNVAAVDATNGTQWDVWTGTQTARAYTLDVTGVVDESGNVLNENADTAVFGGTGVSASNAVPKVTSAVSLNNNTFAVTFDQPLDPATVQTSDFTIAVASGTEAAGRTIVGTIADALIVSEDGKTVTLQFTGGTETMTQGAVYRVTVAGVNTTTGTAIAATDNTASFGGVETANPAPTVTSATAINNQTLRVTFSERITATGLDATDFAIAPTGGNTTAFTGVYRTAVVSPDRMSLTIYFMNDADNATNTDKFVSGGLYTVTVAPVAIADEFGVIQLSNTNNANRVTFAGNNVSASAPRVAAAVAVNANTIDVTFDQPVDATIVPGTVTVTVNAGGAAVPATLAGARAEGNEGTRYRLFFSGTPFTQGTVYKITLANNTATNLNGYQLTNDTNNATFAGINTANPAPTIASAVATAATKIRVTFSEPVTASTVQAADFAISGGATISAVTPVNVSGLGTTTTFDLTIGGTTANTVYTLSIAGASDITGEFGVGTVDTASTATFVAIP